jgi:2-pyrone-4,6-dicarboxylate lactonase
VHGNPAPAVGIVDCHFHVIGPPERYAMAEGRSYTPAPAALSDWRAALGPLGVTDGVVVQPSFYGLDNRALLNATREAAGRLVGIAAVAPDVGEAQLDALAAAGVRGVRVAHFEAGDRRAMGGFVALDAIADLEAFTARLALRDMHLQLFTDSRLLPALEARIARSRVPIVIDHMGRAPAALGVGNEGIDALASLLAEGRIWVKLCGIANISDRSPAYEDARAVHEVLLAANPDQLVWGSDWPHTRPAGERPNTAALLRLFHEWTPAADARELILTVNPARLYRLQAALSAD